MVRRVVSLNPASNDVKVEPARWRLEAKSLREPNYAFERMTGIWRNCPGMTARY